MVHLFRQRRRAQTNKIFADALIIEARALTSSLWQCYATLPLIFTASVFVTSLAFFVRF